MGDEKRETSEYEAMCKAREERQAKGSEVKRVMREQGEIVLERFAAELGDDQVAGIHTPRGIIVVRCPTPAEMRMYRTVARSDKSSQDAKIEAEERLAKSCRLHPSLEEYQSITREFSLVSLSVFAEALKLSDPTEEARAGK